jgi:hypothetical protein
VIYDSLPITGNSLFESCTTCGTFAPDTNFKRDGNAFVCHKCGHRKNILLSDLFVIFGPSGSGKTSLWNHILLKPDKPDVVYLNSDILWRLQEHMSDYVNHWMYICANIAQSGHPVALFSDTEPSEFEQAGSRDLFNQVHYLALNCSESELERRLTNRPPSRESSQPPYIAEMLKWNKSIRARAGSNRALESRESFRTLETTGKSLDETCLEFIQWLNQRLALSEH